MIASQMWMAGIVAEERARLERYQKAWDAYFGSVPPALKVSPPTTAWWMRSSRTSRTPTRRRAPDNSDDLT